jgi:hypothetical protein
MILVAVLALTASDLRAQSAGPVGTAGVEEIDRAAGPAAIFGRRPERRRLIAGMWAMHPFEPQFPELDRTRGMGAQISSWFFATFVNSYDERAFVAGVERYWLNERISVLDFGIGYRVGIVTGYDERLFELARHTPLLPFGGLLLWTEVGPIGIDLFYVYRAITFEGSLRF